MRNQGGSTLAIAMVQASAALLAVLIAVGMPGTASAQLNDWAWMGGTSVIGTYTPQQGICGPKGSYGTKSKAAIANLPGGRSGAGTWTSGNGTLWLFGGLGTGANGIQAELNDLWQFSPATHEWTWIAGPAGTGFAPGVYGTLGAAATANVPGGRTDPDTWMDIHGNLWLFGGSGVDANGALGSMNDLWEFSAASHEWAWMGGSKTLPKGSSGTTGRPGVYGTQGVASSLNIPGGRSGAAAWTDGVGNFWLFGGVGFDITGTEGELNDLWEFNPSLRQWTWIAGSATVGALGAQPGLYGTLGVPNAVNIPGGRDSAISWIDGSGNLWLFGGNGADAEHAQAYAFAKLNDLWKFSPFTTQWTWVGGSETAGSKGGQPGSYGIRGLAQAANLPGGRAQGSGWSDPSGNLWLIGGQGFDEAGNSGELNDLWMYDPVSGLWTWMGGDRTVTANQGAPGVYGEPGAFGPTNNPGGRKAASAWVDKTGDFWLFGGVGYDSAGNAGCLNDLWVLNRTATLPQAAAPGFGETTGDFAAAFKLPISDISPGAAIYYTENGTTPTTSSTHYAGPLTISATTTVKALAVAKGFSNSPVTTATFTLQAGAPVFNPAPGTYSAAQTVRLVDATPDAAIYYTTDGSTPSTNSTQYKGPIAVGQNETIRAIATAKGFAPSAVSSALYRFDFTVNNPASNAWVWVSGSSTEGTDCAPLYGSVNACGQPGSFGEKGVPALSNVPAGRDSAMSWTDNMGNLWVFGGVGFTTGYLEQDNDLWEYIASTGEWVWVNGAFAMNGLYGIQGIPDPLNVPPMRQQASGWADREGNLWLFGGFGWDSANHGGALNDLWRYQPSTNEWTWMGGSDTMSCANVDGYFQCGSMGSYGTVGVPGTDDMPAGRTYATTWTDSAGNFWLFGGGSIDLVHVDGTYINDLWRFNSQTQVWTWMSGSAIAGASEGQPGVYGKRGTPAAANTPGGRDEAAGWTDAKGNLWLFGGLGFDQNDAAGYLNDLWEFSPTNREWTWMGGNATVPAADGSAGDYGTLGAAASTNMPGSRQGASTWVDPNGNFWLFGGNGFDSAGALGYLNDFWMYDPVTQLWTWMGGSDLASPCTVDGSATYCGPSGVYGSRGVGTSSNIPGARWNASAFAGNGSVWLFGGFGVDSVGTWGELNDLWTFERASAPLTTATPAFSAQPGQYAAPFALSMSDATPGAVIYYTTNGESPTTSSAVYSQPLTVAGNETIQAAAVAPGYLMSGVAMSEYTAQSLSASAVTLKITAGGGSVTSVPEGTPVALTAVVMSHGKAVTSGQVKFCDATAKACADIHLLGTAQITSAGTAVLRSIPGPGSHSYKAEFTGIADIADPAASAAASLDVVKSKFETSTAMASELGAAGYTLQATVTSTAFPRGIAAPAGEVSFLDTSAGGRVLAEAALAGAGTSLAWSTSQSFSGLPGPNSVVVGDFNMDGVTDIAVLETSSSTVTILLGNGNGTFTTVNESPSTGYGPVSIAVADCNGDGIPDLVVANEWDSSLSILLGKGDGTFVSGPSTSISDPEMMTVADFNGDGKTDIAVLSTSGAVEVVLGNGDGTFTPVASSPQLGYDVYGVVSGDFNGDGKADLAIVTFDGSGSVLLGNGDGTFKAPTQVGAGYGAYAIAAGDFNGDGKLDLAFADSGGVTIQLGKGNGTFTQAAGYSAYSDFLSVTVGDFNGDGIADLALANYVGGTLTVLLGVGDGSFVAAPSSPSTTVLPGSIAAADLNGDGVQDLIWTNGDTGAAGVVLSQPIEISTATAPGVLPADAGPDAVVASYAGDAHHAASKSLPVELTLKPHYLATTTSLALSANGIAVKTVNAGTAVKLTATVKAGGKAPQAGLVNFCDAASAHCSDIHLLGTAALTADGTAAISLLPAAGAHKYSAILVPTDALAASTSATQELTVNAKAPTIVGLAQSGASGNYTLTATVAGSAGKSATVPTGSVSFVDTSNGNAVLGTAPLKANSPSVGWFSSQSPSLGQSPTVVAVADFNGDGIPDVAVGYGDNIFVNVLLGNGDGTFGLAQNPPNVQNYPAEWISVGDFNHDGIPDMAMISQSDDGETNNVFILLGNGDGTFRTVLGPSIPGDASSIAVADLNGDGIEDMAISNPGENNVAIFLGKGDGTFVTGQVAPAGNGPNAVVAGDFRGHGVTDIAVANFTEGTVWLLLGNGDGTFRHGATETAGSGPYAMVAADFNQDGNLDLAVANAKGGTVSVLLGKGDGTFKAASSLAVGSQPSSIAFGDFNGDGKVDLVTTNPYAGSLTVMLGNGDGTFKAGTSPPQETNPFDVATGDFNGDGTSDIAVADFTNPGPNGPVAIVLADEVQATAVLQHVSVHGSGTHEAAARYAGNTLFPAGTSQTTPLQPVAATTKGAR